MGPVMTRGESCKHTRVGNTIIEYVRNFLVDMVCEVKRWILRIILNECVLCDAGSLEKRAWALPEAYVLRA